MEKSIIVGVESKNLNLSTTVTCKDACCFECCRYNGREDCGDGETSLWPCCVGNKGDNDCLASREGEPACKMFVRRKNTKESK